jgi:hemolysin activation/secretion protein
MIGYNLGHATAHHKLSLTAELYGSPGGMSFGNRTKKMEAFQYGANSQYLYFKLSHSLAYRFGYFWLSYDINGQIANQNLLPSEQLTLSGYNGVRGFEERIVNVDNGVLLNLSLETPRVSIGKWAGWSKRSFDELYFLAFFDYGFGANHKHSHDEQKTVLLASLGPGVRYQIDRYFTLRFDYGFQLFHHGFYNPTHSRYNFGLITSF